MLQCNANKLNTKLNIVGYAFTVVFVHVQMRLLCGMYKAFHYPIAYL